MDADERTKEANLQLSQGLPVIWEQACVGGHAHSNSTMSIHGTETPMKSIDG